MKKIPTLFVKEYTDKHSYTMSRQVTPGMEWVLAGEGVATIKWDGTPVYYDPATKDCQWRGWMIRYDLKPGRKLPSSYYLPCQEKADEVTGHFPHWIPVKWDDPADRYICDAIREFVRCNAQLPGGSFEAIGYGINGNPYHMKGNSLMYHGSAVLLDIPRTYGGIREWLASHNALEGIVFWLNGEPKCKIRRVDFGYAWNGKGGE